MGLWTRTVSCIACSVLLALGLTLGTETEALAALEEEEAPIAALLAFLAR